ncbi:MAG: succinyl-diaminopimelate desuccinylase [Rickettsiaceae bacterium]|nr:succinyl-diaminopimelate desuccinylase [Rickettsiaceae bacterium]
MSLPIVDPIELAKKLINFPSVTPSDEGCLVYIEQLLKDSGFTCYLQVFGPKGEETTNLYAQYGSKGPNICFAGHIDVVPPGPLSEWSASPYKDVDSKAGYVYGRGAVDMKGPLAAMLAAAINFARSDNLDASISFLLTSDEEGKATYGTPMMLEWLKENHNITIDFALVGEPSCKNFIGDQLALGRRGSINFNLTINGKQGHVAYQDEALNPLTIASKVQYELVTTKLDQIENKKFSPSNLELTSLDVGNYVTNLIPNSVNIRFNIRYNDCHKAENLVSLIEGIVSRHSDRDNFELEYSHTALPFFNEADRYTKLLERAIEDETGLKPAFITSGGTSDARFLIKHCQVVEFGALYNLAHQVDECISVADLGKLYNIYYRFLNQLK